MRSKGLLWGVVILLAVVHFFLTMGLGLGAGVPDLLSVALLLAAREMRMGWAAGLGFAFGLLEDAFAALAFGANTVAMTAVGILGSRSRDLFVGESFIFLISYLAVGKWVRDLVHWVVAGDVVRGPFTDVVLIQAPLHALYAAAVGTAVAGLAGIWRDMA